MLSDDSPGPAWAQSFFGERVVDKVTYANLECWNVLNDVCEMRPDFEFADSDARLLEDLPHLTHLSTSNTQLTNRGLASIAKLRKLNTLHLSSPHVTDDGLRHLAHLKRLKLLFLYCPKVTDAGVDWLSQQLPDTDIYCYEHTLSLDELDGGGFM